jgi:hypothetical protein
MIEHVHSVLVGRCEEPKQFGKRNPGFNDGIHVHIEAIER